MCSNLWTAEKSFGFSDPSEEVEAWRKTVRVLDSLVDMADALMLDPLIMVLGESLARAAAELRRAES